MARDEELITPEQLVVYRTLGLAIENRRKNARLNQTELGDRVGRSQRQMCSYETGKAPTPLHVVMAIEDALRLGRGTILEDAGLVLPADGDVLDLIRRDRTIDDVRREVIIDLYEKGRERHQRGG